MVERLSTTLLIRPEDIPPSHENMKVIGTFNPGVVDLGDEIVILLRVAEQPTETREGFVALPRWQNDGQLMLDWISCDDINQRDPRGVRFKGTKYARLTHTSHFVVVRTKDGKSIDSIDEQRFCAATNYEQYGVEDPRIVKIDDRCYISYVAVSPHGAATALASTTDFRDWQRHGIIFCPENKDVTLFPEKVNGEYVALHRPSGAFAFSAPEMWLAWSKDLVYWGRHDRLHGGISPWERGRIGAGAPPFLADGGWLEIYHGSQRKRTGVNVYSAGALLLDKDDPSVVKKATSETIMTPQNEFESVGFVSNVVFPTGTVQRDDVLQVYYGAADSVTGMAEFRLQDLLDQLR